MGMQGGIGGGFPEIPPTPQDMSGNCLECGASRDERHKESCVYRKSAVLAWTALKERINEMKE